MGILFELFFAFFKIGLFTFGGGYAMISLIDHECVNKKKWITTDELLDVTVIAESTPGPIAINCATYTGYKRAGFLGASMATIGVVLPSYVILLFLSTCMENLQQYVMVVKAFYGIRVAVGLLIMQAGIRMLKKMKKIPTSPTQATMAFLPSTMKCTCSTATPSSAATSK